MPKIQFKFYFQKGKIARYLIDFGVSFDEKTELLSFDKDCDALCGDYPLEEVLDDISEVTKHDLDENRFPVEVAMF